MNDPYYNLEDKMKELDDKFKALEYEGDFIMKDARTRFLRAFFGTLIIGGIIAAVVLS